MKTPEPPLGPHQNIAIMFGMEKVERCGYPTAKNFSRYVHSFRWTDTMDVSGSNGGLRLDWPTVMFDNFLHQLVSGSLPS